MKKLRASPWSFVNFVVRLFSFLWHNPCQRKESPAYTPIRSTLPMYGRNASGIRMDPSAC